MVKQSTNFSGMAFEKFVYVEHSWVGINCFVFLSLSFLNALRRIIKTSHHVGVESTILKNIKNQVELTRKVVHCE